MTRLAEQITNHHCGELWLLEKQLVDIIIITIIIIITKGPNGYLQCYTLKIQQNNMNDTQETQERYEKKNKN